jgi:hypothetical protein
MSKFKEVKVDPWANATLPADAKADLLANIELCRDAIVFFTACGSASGYGGHTGGAFDTMPEVMLLRSFFNARFASLDTLARTRARTHAQSHSTVWHIGSGRKGAQNLNLATRRTRAHRAPTRGCPVADMWMSRYTKMHGKGKQEFSVLQCHCRKMSVSHGQRVASVAQGQQGWHRRPASHARGKSTWCVRQAWLTCLVHTQCDPN